MITLKQYLKDRDALYRQELTDEILKNAQGLIEQVNTLLERLNITDVSVTSGWRPAVLNKVANGAKASYHLMGRAVDLGDITGRLGYQIIQNHQLLEELGLWLEYPRFTPGWVHLDNGTRAIRSVRTFIP